MVIRNKTIKKKKNVKIGGMAPVANAPKGKKPNKCDPAKLKTISHKKNAKMRLICNKYCSSKPTACGGYDEYGEVIPMESVCKEANVCPQTTRFIDIPRNIIKLVNEMKILLEQSTGAYKKRETPESKARKQAKRDRLKELNERIKVLKEQYKARGAEGGDKSNCFGLLGDKISDGLKKYEQLEGACERGEIADNYTDMESLVKCVDLYQDLINEYSKIKNEINDSKLESGIQGAFKRFGTKLLSREEKAKRKLAGLAVTGSFKRKSIRKKCQKALMKA